MNKIFLSHATEEHDLVVHLANYIEKNDLEAWYAPRNIMGGIDYDKEIIAAIKDCRAFVLLLSRNSDASEDVKTEVYHAVKFKKRVICLDVDDVEPENLSYLLGMRHRLNWLERRDETLDKLVHDIKIIPDPASCKATKPTFEAQPIIETKPTDEAKPTVEIKPIVEAQPTVKAEPTVETKPTAETKTKAETEAVIQKLRQKKQSKVPDSEPETKRWLGTVRREMTRELKMNRKDILLVCGEIALCGIIAYYIFSSGLF